MSIQTGQALPTGQFKTINASGIQDVDTGPLFKGRKVAVFGLPGAYTPVCSASHLPGYVENASKLKAAGFDEIACISVNDPFVMDAWGKEHGAAGKVTMLSDTDASFTRRSAWWPTSAHSACTTARSAMRWSSRTVS